MMEIQIMKQMSWMMKTIYNLIQFILIDLQFMDLLFYDSTILQ